MVEESFGIIPLRKNERGEWHVFLIHQKNGDFWGFPKGHPVKGEMPHQTAERELFEETGLRPLEYLKTKPLTSHYTFNRKGVKINKQITLFPAITTVNPSLQANEVITGKWLSLTDAQNTISYLEGKDLIKQLSKQQIEND